MNKTAFAKPLAALTILLSSGAVLTTSLAPEAEAGWDYLSHNHVKMNQWQLKSYYTQNPIIQNTELEDRGNRWIAREHNGSGNAKELSLKTYRSLNSNTKYNIFVLDDNASDTSRVDSVGGIVPFNVYKQSTTTVDVHHPYLWDVGSRFAKFDVALSTETVSVKMLDYQIRNHLIKNEKLYDKRESGVLNITSKGQTFVIPLNHKLSEAYADKHVKAEDIISIRVDLKRKDR